MKEQTHGRSRGSVLLVAVGVITVLSFMVIGFSYLTRIELQSVTFRNQQMQSIELARAGIEAAKLVLLEDRNEPEVENPHAGIDHFGDQWAQTNHPLLTTELGDGQYLVSISDESSKFNINRLASSFDKSGDPEHAENLLRKLAEILNLSGRERDEFVDCLMDWMDPNELHRLNGAENQYYLGLPLPYHAKNGAFDHLDEFLLVRGIDPAMLQRAGSTNGSASAVRLDEMLTVHAIEKININTARPETLELLFTFMKEWNKMLPNGNSVSEGIPFEITREMIQNLVDYRNGPDKIPGTEDDQLFKSVSEIANVWGSDGVAGSLENILDVRSSHFYIESVGHVAEVQSKVRAVLKREGTSIQIIDWQEQPL